MAEQTKLPSTAEARATLMDGVWTWKDAVAILALAVAVYSALAANGVIDTADEPEPAPEVVEGATE